MERVTAIVLAAGRGSRMNSDKPKQFMELNGRPILSYSIEAFEKSKASNIILVTNKEYIEYCRKEIVEKFRYNKVEKIIAGGDERFWSVKNGLEAIDDAEYVLIHDAARPCITPELIDFSIGQVVNDGACTLGVPVKDTIKIVDDERFGVSTPPRNYLWQIQTPQSFRYDELCEAYEKMELSGARDITDDTMIVERYLNKKTRVIMGDYHNVKVTTNDDLEIVGIFLKNMQKSC